MLIVGQDKDIIMNFENIEILGIGNPLEDDDGKFKILANTTSDSQYTLAKYDTKERAEEVFDEIVKKYSSYLSLRGGPAIMQGQMDVQPNIFNIPKIYEMPKE